MARNARHKGVIQSDDFFDDQRAFVYPSPEMPGKGFWAGAATTARELTDEMSPFDKIAFISGTSDKPNGCHGYIPKTDNFENITYTFPGMCFADSANGLRATDFVSSFPSGIHTGASWNRDLTHARASAMGEEFKKKGVNVLLGPVVGPLGRLPLGGRNWEGFSNDPYLAGALAFATVEGIQDQGVIASTKHFIGNEQETNRVPKNKTGDSCEQEAVSSNIGEDALRELYAWPFQDALRAGSGSIMCSYQRINNTYGCANSYTLNGLLKSELGFEGFVVSDWDAQHDGAAAAEAGLDMVMPGDRDWALGLRESSLDDSGSEARLADMVNRILTSFFRINGKAGHSFSDPGHGIPTSLSDSHDIVDARDPDARRTLFKGAVEGHVLVKNANNTLPLDKPRLISLFGYSATSPAVLNPVEGEIESFAWSFGAQSASAEEVYAGFNGQTSQNISTIARGGTLIHGGGSSATTPSAFLSPFDALKLRAIEDETVILYDFESSQPVVHAESDVCIVFGNAWASEGYDRPALRDDYTDALIEHIADRCERTIVVFHNAGVRLVDTFVDHPNVTAIIFAHLPGEQTGNALTALLYGHENFSGKLPYTVPRNETDYGDLLNPAVPGEQPEIYHHFPQSNFSEGLNIDYRHFDTAEYEVRYDFGFGMSYTTFALSNLTLVSNYNAARNRFAKGEIVQGGRKDLWDVPVRAYVTLENTGTVAGAEVAQLYLSIPNRPSKQLRGFSKHYLEPGQSVEVDFPLTRRDLSIWNTEVEEWELQRPEFFHITVGTSRGDGALAAAIGIDEAEFKFPGFHPLMLHPALKEAGDPNNPEDSESLRPLAALLDEVLRPKPQEPESSMHPLATVLAEVFDSI